MGSLPMGGYVIFRPAEGFPSFFRSLFGESERIDSVFDTLGGLGVTFPLRITRLVDSASWLVPRACLSSRTRSCQLALWVSLVLFDVVSFVEVVKLSNPASRSHEVNGFLGLFWLLQLL